MLDLNRVDGVIDYKHNLPDWTESHIVASA